ncbi:lytic transglycosylase domain-containing protein [Sphingomonas colocasiae]|nr:lytic transglycosylase domain-containing protein [Sphingomonas colocasiae]
MTLVLAGTLAAAAPWRPQILEASARCGVPVEWIARVIHAESRGRTHLGGRPIRSPKGAMGLMQLMPGTWAEMRRDLGLGDDPDAPRDNILAGACYLRRMYDRFGHPGLFAAYNAGPARYARALKGRLLPAETIAYLRVVAGDPAAAAHAGPASPPVLFALRRTDAPTAAGEVSRAPVDPLFAIRADAR